MVRWAAYNLTMRRPPNRIRDVFLHRYSILAALSLIAGVTAYLGRGIWVIDAFAANVSAGFIGALLTVVFIDRAAERRDEVQRRKMERIALRQALYPLDSIARTLADMIKSSLPTPAPEIPETYQQLFAPSFLHHLDWLDMSGSAGRFPEVDWYTHLQNTVPKAFSDLSHVVEKYVQFLDVTFVEHIEALRQDSFIQLLLQIGAARPHLRAQGHRADYSFAGHDAARAALFGVISKLIEYHDDHAEVPMTFPRDGLSRDDVAPRAGSCRLPEA